MTSQTAREEELINAIGERKLIYRKQENYSGEHREWEATLDIPKNADLFREIVADILPIIARIEAEALAAWNTRAPDPRLAEVEAERDGLREALDGIAIYGSDTLSGRVKPDPATYRAWLIEGIIEMRNRARAALGAKP